MKKIILGFSVIVALGIATWYLNNSKTENQNAEAPLEMTGGSKVEEGVELTKIPVESAVTSETEEPMKAGKESSAEEIRNKVIADLVEETNRAREEDEMTETLE